MDLIAKGSPSQLGEDYVGFELYLSEDMYKNNNVEEIIDKIGNNNIEVVHTPHVGYEEYEECLIFCNELASNLDASIVCHSSYIRTLMVNEFVDFDVLDVEYGFENHCGLSVPQIESTIFDEGHNLVLDVAHLFVTNDGLYKRNLAYLLHEYPDKISSMHLCDSTPNNDGLPIGKGDMDIEHTVESILRSNYNGYVVVEVPVKDRKESIKKVQSIVSNSGISSDSS